MPELDPTTNTPTADEQVRQLANLADRAFKHQRPLFILVQYNHEADKLSFLNDIKTRLAEKQIDTCSYDPHNHTEHGVSQLYPLLKYDAAEQRLSLVVSMPRATDSDDLAADFLSYINLHRDSIAEHKLHWVLFLRDSEMATFIRGASDLWSFCHRTFWLERQLEKSTELLWQELWQDMDTAQVALPLTDAEHQQIKTHVQSVQQLVDDTVDKESQARLLLDLSHWLVRHDAPTMAIEAALKGIELLEGQPCDLLAELENHIGWIYHQTSANAEALSHYKSGLTLSQTLNNQTLEGVILNNIAQVYSLEGDYDTALPYLEKSLVILRQIDDKIKESATLNNIAQIYKARGEYAVALDYLEQALAIWQDNIDNATVGNIVNNIGIVHYAQEDFTTALDYFNQALTIRQNVGDKAGVAGSLSNIASIHNEKGDYDTALDYLKQALTITRNLQDKIAEGTILNNIAQIHNVKGDYASALKRFKQAKTLQTDTSDKAGLCLTLYNMGHIYWKNNQQEEALSTWLKVYQMAKSMQLAQLLDALSNLAPTVGLPLGLEGWEQLSHQSNESKQKT